MNFEVVHIAEYLYELLNAGRLQINKEYAQQITYHDPVIWAGIMVSMMHRARY